MGGATRAEGAAHRGLNARNLPTTLKIKTTKEIHFILFVPVLVYLYICLYLCFLFNSLFPIYFHVCLDRCAPRLK